MPKLLQINSTLNWGSTGHIAEQIGLLAQLKGWDCYIAHGSRYQNSSNLKEMPVGTIMSDYCHVFKSMIMGKHGLGSKRATYRFVKEVEKINPDIIHLHNIHGYYLNYEVLFEWLSKSNTPVVWTLHDCWTMTGHCTHFDEIGCEKWKTQCCDCPLLHYGYRSFFFDRSRSNYKLKKELFTSIPNMTIVSVSEWLKEKVGESFLKKYPIRVIRNGIDLDVFKPSFSNLRNELRIVEGKIVLLGVASAWGEGKGLSEFCELSKNDHFQVILIGVSESIKRHLPNTIIAVSRTTNQEELAAYYTMADVFVNPTHCDSFPTVNLESLACGTPVVTYRTGGSPEAIDKNTGIVVEKGDFEGLVNAIGMIETKDKDLMAIACRKRAERFFNKNDRFLDYISLYQSLL